jgi:hypothetical protein
MVHVLFVGGFGRSGTTLVSRMLGELPDVCAIGETVNIWRQGVLLNERCGCGSDFYECPFWQQVGKLAFGGWDTINSHYVLTLKSSIDRFRFIPALMAPKNSSTIKRRLEEYSSLYAKLYSAVSEVSRCSFIIDSSKHASLAHCLRHRPDLDLRVVHMIRDSRGVAYSWSKAVARPEAQDATNLMDQFSPYHASLLWNSYNASLSLLPRLGVPSLQLRYEDFVKAPEWGLHQISHLSGIDIIRGSLAFLGEGCANFGATHSVAGNPMRFKYGTVAVREDDEWRSKLSIRDQIVVTGLTLPLLLRYGYLPHFRSMTNPIARPQMHGREGRKRGAKLD